jgi:hypothetical protein
MRGVKIGSCGHKGVAVRSHAIQDRARIAYDALDARGIGAAAANRSAATV